MQLLDNSASDESSDAFKKLVDFIIISPNDASILTILVGKLQEILDDSESRGSIIRTLYPSLGVIVVTVEIEQSQFGNLMIKLAFLSDVERVDEEIKTQEEFVGSLSKYVSFTKLNIEPSKRVCLILKEPDMIASN